jgi:hypothetical protein
VVAIGLFAALLLAASGTAHGVKEGGTFRVAFTVPFFEATRRCTESKGAFCALPVAH